LIESEAKVARGVAALYVAGITTLGLNTLFLVLLTNSLPQAEVGLISFLNVVLISASTIGVLALPLIGSAVVATPPAVTRFLSVGRREGLAQGRRVYFLSLGLCFAITLAILAISAYPPIANLVAGPAYSSAVFFACLDATVYSLGQLGVYAMLGIDRVASAGKLIIVSSALRYLFASAFVLDGLGPAWIFIGFALGDLFLAAAANLRAFGELRHGAEVSTPFRTVFKYMASVFVAALVGLAVGQSDKLLVYVQTDSVHLAVYNVATVGAAVASFIPNSVTNVLVPSLAAQGDNVSAKRDLLRSYSRHVNLTALPVGFEIAAVSPFLLKVFELVGNPNVPYAQGGAPIMALIAVSISFTAVSAVFSSSLLVDDRAHHFTMSNLLGLAGLVLVALMTVPTIGFLGIALGRSAMQFIILGTTMYFVWRSGRLTLDSVTYAKSVAASGIAALFVFGFLYILNGYVLSRTAIVVASLVMLPVGFLLYLVAMKVFRAYKEEDMQFLDSLLPRRLRFFSRLARKLL
jgi:O-antigen/teichoic acid export membrane protein